jgi:hypothetical protein
MVTNWVTPRGPATDDGQTIFLFSSIVGGSNRNAIIQAVLQWGPSTAGGGPYWTLASWLIDYRNGMVFHSDLIGANQADNIYGSANFYTTSGGYWSVAAYNVTQNWNPSTLIAFDTLPFTEMDLGVVELWNVFACSDLPSTDLFRPYGVMFQDLDRNLITPSWSDFASTSYPPYCTYAASHDQDTAHCPWWVPASQCSQAFLQF